MPMERQMAPILPEDLLTEYVQLPMKSSLFLIPMERNSELKFGLLNFACFLQI